MIHMDAALEAALREATRPSCNGPGCEAEATFELRTTCRHGHVVVLLLCDADERVATSSLVLCSRCAVTTGHVCPVVERRSQRL